MYETKLILIRSGGCGRSSHISLTECPDLSSLSGRQISSDSAYLQLKHILQQIILQQRYYFYKKSSCRDANFHLALVGTHLLKYELCKFIPNKMASLSLPILFLAIMQLE